MIDALVIHLFNGRPSHVYAFTSWANAVAFLASKRIHHKVRYPDTFSVDEIDRRYGFTDHNGNSREYIVSKEVYNGDSAMCSVFTPCDDSVLNHPRK